MVQIDLACIKSTVTPLTSGLSGRVRAGFGTGLGLELFQLMRNKRLCVEAIGSGFIETYNIDSIYLPRIYGNFLIYSHLRKKNFSQILNVNILMLIARPK